MKFILLLCTLTTIFSLTTTQSSKSGSSIHDANNLGKNIPGTHHIKFKEVSIYEQPNDNHFITSAIIPDWETICK